MYIVWFQKISITTPQKDLPYDPAPSPPDFPKTAPKIYLPLLRNFQNFHTPPGNIAISHWSEQRGNFLFTTMPNFVSFMYFCCIFQQISEFLICSSHEEIVQKVPGHTQMKCKVAWGIFFSLALLSERLEQAKFAVKLRIADFIYKKIVMQSLTCWKRLVYLMLYREIVKWRRNATN